MQRANNCNMALLKQDARANSSLVSLAAVFGPRAFYYPPNDDVEDYNPGKVCTETLCTKYVLKR